MEIVVDTVVIKIYVITPQGRLDTFSAPQLREKLEALFTEGGRKFVIDLSSTPFLDSAGMAALVSLLKRAREEDGDVRLVWPREEAARRILNLTKFDRVFQICDSAESALEGF